MIPKSVQFNGVNVDPRKVLTKSRNAPIPLDWVLYEFALTTDQHSYRDPKNQLEAWLKNNINNRFTISTFMAKSDYIVVIGFESETDAVMFRLMDGHIAWQVGHEKINKTW